MRAKLESHNAWKKMKEDYNTIDLLKTLRDITYKFEGHNNHAGSTMEEGGNI